jgi:hypothetical protein
VSCDCVEKAREGLAAMNTEIDIPIMFSHAGKGAKLSQDRVAIVTKRIKPLRDGKKAALLVATFCPFCGVAYDALDARKGG